MTATMKNGDRMTSIEQHVNQIAPLKARPPNDQYVQLCDSEFGG
jgi:hypothetical protein